MKATKNTLKKRKHYPKWESEKTVRKGGSDRELHTQQGWILGAMRPKTKLQEAFWKGCLCTTPSIWASDVHATWEILEKREQW